MQFFEWLQVNWVGHFQIFTDGSVDPNSNRAGFVVHIPDLQVTVNGVAVFTAQIATIIWGWWGR